VKTVEAKSEDQASDGQVFKREHNEAEEEGERELKRIKTEES